MQAFKYLFTSPSSVTDDGDDPISSTTPQPNPPAKRHKTSEKKSASTRTNVALLMGLKSVTARAIAYVAVQVRTSMSYHVLHLLIVFSCATLFQVQALGRRRMASSIIWNSTTQLSTTSKRRLAHWLPSM